jgi:hypothetical protein
MKATDTQEKVDSTIKELKDEFQQNGSLFYTENEIVCHFYSILQGKLDWKLVEDRAGRLHYLVHREYPTPFRCDMRGAHFKVKSDDDWVDREKKKGKFKRGHYDIVVLNPAFIQAADYQSAKAQNYERVKDDLKKASQPTILYGLEFMFNRDPFESQKTKLRGTSLENFPEKVLQDYEKLRQSVELGDGARFMDKIAMLVFDNTGDQLKNKLKESDNLVLCLRRKEGSQ